ncbi:hypothetical protein [Thermobacillus composti]|uniref:hypothetical protein n=1 Tax=Thermobacillus composti TaxID=377615 RepID=UPI0012FB10FF|nr:hypothetical protein [Thermobacillus composti]
MSGHSLPRKAAVLKRFELYGYRIAYYLLENEDLAAARGGCRPCPACARRRFLSASPSGSAADGEAGVHEAVP